MRSKQRKKSEYKLHKTRKERECVYVTGSGEREREYVCVAAYSSRQQQQQQHSHFSYTLDNARLRLRYDERRAKQHFCIVYGEFLVNFVVEGSTQCCVLSISFETSRCLATSLFSSTQKVQRVLFVVCDIGNETNREKQQQRQEKKKRDFLYTQIFRWEREFPYTLNHSMCDSATSNNANLFWTLPNIERQSSVAWHKIHIRNAFLATHQVVFSLEKFSRFFGQLFFLSTKFFFSKFLRILFHLCRFICYPAIIFKKFPTLYLVHNFVF